MADYSITYTIKGISPLDGKNATAATVKVTSNQSVVTPTTVNNLVNKIQPMTSATVTTVSRAMTVGSDYAAEYIENKPGDYLQPDEVFQEDFTDTSMVPSLQFSGKTSDDKTVTIATIKYMADPEDTTDFEAKVQAAAQALIALGTSAVAFDTARMTFTAKEAGIYTAE